MRWAVVTLLHISDLHFGGAFASHRGQAILQLAERLQPTAVLATGDLVNWAETDGPWHTLQGFLHSLTPPWLTIPGNHDLDRLNPVGRLLHPFRRYRRFVHSELDRCLFLPGATVIGLGSPRRFCIDLGYLSARQMAWANAMYNAAPAANLRVLMMHHPLKSIPGTGLLRAHVWGSRKTQMQLAQMGVDLVLSGHNHFPHLETLITGTSTTGPVTTSTAAEPASHRLVWAQAGTASSWRIPKQAASNSVSIIKATPDSLQVDWWYYCKIRQGFRPGETQTLVRNQRGSLAPSIEPLVNPMDEPLATGRAASGGDGRQRRDYVVNATPAADRLLLKRDGTFGPKDE